MTRYERGLTKGDTMSRPANHHRRQRFTPSQYQTKVQEVAMGRIVSTALEIVTPEMEDAAVAVHGLMQASGPKVKERIRAAMIASSRDREWDVRDELVRATATAYQQY